MKLKTKTAFAIAGIIIAFYLINLSIMTYLIYKTNQDYLAALLDEREEVLREMISDEFSEIESYLRLFITLTDYSEGSVNVREIIGGNYHLDALIIVRENRTEIISDQTVSKEDLKFISENLRLKNSESFECGFEKAESLYMICGYSSKSGMEYILVDVIDRKFFEKTKPLLALDVFYFSENSPVIDSRLISIVPAERINGGVAGYFVIGYSKSASLAVIQNIEIGVLVFTASAFLLSTLGYIMFQRDVLRRIYAIRDFMIRIKEHRFRADEEINVEGDDEITELAGSINSALNELEKSRNELEKALENLRVLNRVLRHDLLNDLTAIRGFAELGADECDTCSKIVDKTDKAVRTIRMLRDVENIIKESDLERFRISEVIRTVIETYDVDFEIEGDADVYADNGIYSVFDNLINNSIKHGKSRKIRFEVRDEGDLVHVTVRDYGTGIPQESIDRIFDEGFSLAGSTGIGLYIVRRFMEKYGGRVEVESSERDGAVFHLFFRRFRGGNQAQETSSSE